MLASLEIPQGAGRMAQPASYLCVNFPEYSCAFLLLSVQTERPRRPGAPPKERFPLCAPAVVAVCQPSASRPWLMEIPKPLLSLSSSPQHTRSSWRATPPPARLSLMLQDIPSPWSLHRASNTFLMLSLRFPFLISKPLYHSVAP